MWHLVGLISEEVLVSHSAFGCWPFLKYVYKFNYKDVYNMKDLLEYDQPVFFHKIAIEDMEISCEILITHLEQIYIHILIIFNIFQKTFFLMPETQRKGE